MSYTGTYTLFDETKIATVYLEEGEHEYKVEHAVKNFGFMGVRFTHVNDEEMFKDGFDSLILRTVNK